MKVHHLNCATLCPRGGRFLGGSGPVYRASRLVCHCLLIETDSGLVLVDTGLGTQDLAHPRERLGLRFLIATLPRLSRQETALDQVRSLGFSASDVRHIVLTHLDPDHAGGLSDFPDAKVHVLAEEHAHATALSGPNLHRYRRHQWAHNPDWQFYAPHGERWFGFECVRRLHELPPEILLVPLRGHSLGHTAVAVSTGSGWLLHAGDAYFYHGEVASPPHCPRVLELFQRVVEVDGKARRDNLQRLRDLVAERAAEVRVFCSHDALELERLQGENAFHGAAVEARPPLGAPS